MYKLQKLHNNCFVRRAARESAHNNAGGPLPKKKMFGQIWSEAYQWGRNSEEQNPVRKNGSLWWLLALVKDPDTCKQDTATFIIQGSNTKTKNHRVPLQMDSD